MLRIRAMVESDFEAVTRLWKASEGLGLCGPRQAFDRFLKRNEGMSPVAVHDGEVVGAVHCGDDGYRGYLYHLAVDQRFQGQGIGRALIDWCLDRLAARGLTRCSIFVYRENSEGEKFWRGIGWRERIDLNVFAKDLQ